MVKSIGEVEVHVDDDNYDDNNDGDYDEDYDDYDEVMKDFKGEIERRGRRSQRSRHQLQAGSCGKGALIIIIIHHHHHLRYHRRRPHHLCRPHHHSLHPMTMIPNRW